MADPADAKDYDRPHAVAAGFDWPTREKQIQVESGWRHWSSPGVVLSSPTGSMGLGQLNSRFYPESDWRDPYRNLDKSLEINVSYLRTYGSYRKGLAAYNWGPGNVGGYTDSQGNVHPAWDGTREWVCPVGLAQCRTTQRDHYLDVILGPGWPEPNAAPVPAPPPAGNPAVGYDDYRDDAPAGRFVTTPKGIILHGSRSGATGNPKAKEYVGTARYEVSNPDGLGWNATIGENRVAIHLDPQAWGWNARGCSDNYLGVELAQATVDEPITDPQVAAFVDWVKTRVLPSWPSLPLVFPTHAELDGTPEYGPYHDRKTDVWPRGDARTEDLRRRIMDGLKGAIPVPPPTPEYSVGPGILSAMQAQGDRPSTDELYFKKGERDEWSEAYGVSGARYLYLVSINKVFRYDPAA